jgi:integrase
MARGKDRLYRRDGILTFRYRDLDGKWREKSTGKKDRAEARTFRDDFLDDLKQGSLPTEMADWRLDEAEKWWIEFRKPRTAENTQNSERYRLQHLRLIVGKKRLREITNRDLDNYTTARLGGYEFTNKAGEKETRRGVAEWSINKEILLWSLILKKAKLWRRLADDYRPLKTKASDIGKAITRDELRHLAEVAAKDTDWEAAFYGSVLASNTGLRGGEIKKLRVGEIDLERRQLRIRRADAKSDASARSVELNADATEAAARLLMRAASLKPPATKPEHYLMPKHLSRIAHGPHKGERGYDPTQHQAYWDTAWATLTEKAGLDGFRFHDLRHTFISHMVEKGIPLGLIQTMVGHISSRMLLHYAHISSGAARRAVEALDSEAILTPSLTVAKPEPAEKVYRA